MENCKEKLSSRHKMANIHVTSQRISQQKKTQKERRKRHAFGLCIYKIFFSFVLFIVNIIFYLQHFFFQPLPFSPHSPSNSWTCFSLIAIACTCICIYTYIPSPDNVTCFQDNVFRNGHLDLGNKFSCLGKATNYASSFT